MEGLLRGAQLSGITGVLLLDRGPFHVGMWSSLQMFCTDKAVAYLEQQLMVACHLLQH